MVDIPEFVKTLRKAGIDHFIVTDESTALMRGLRALCITTERVVVATLPQYFFFKRERSQLSLLGKIKTIEYGGGFSHGKPSPHSVGPSGGI